MFLTFYNINMMVLLVLPSPKRILGLKLSYLLGNVERLKCVVRWRKSFVAMCFTSKRLVRIQIDFAVDRSLGPPSCSINVGDGPTAVNRHVGRCSCVYYISETSRCRSIQGVLFYFSSKSRVIGSCGKKTWCGNLLRTQAGNQV